MIRLSASVVLGSLLLASPTAGANKCPPDTLGPNYPWFIHEAMPGDLWAEIFLEMDKEGRPTGCTVGTNNVVRDQEYRACAVYLRGWRMDAPKDGTAVPPVVRQLFLVRKRNHVRAERRARAAFFAEHPELDPACYPKDY